MSTVVMYIIPLNYRERACFPHAYVLNYRERGCFPCVSCLEEGSVPSIPGALQPPPAQQPETPAPACDQTKKDAQ